MKSCARKLLSVLGLHSLESEIILEVEVSELYGYPEVKG